MRPTKCSRLPLHEDGKVLWVTLHDVLYELLVADVTVLLHTYRTCFLLIYYPFIAKMSRISH